MKLTIHISDSDREKFISDLAERVLANLPQATATSAPAAPERERLAYTIPEAAQLLGVSYITVYRLIQRGPLKSSSALRTKIIPKRENERFLKATCS